MIHLTPEEKNLVLAAIKYENAIQDHTDDEENEWIDEKKKSEGKIYSCPGHNYTQ